MKIHQFFVILTACLYLLSCRTNAQRPSSSSFEHFIQEFSPADSLRGKLNPLRSHYDVRFYELKVQVFPNQKFIKGSNVITFTALENLDKIQIDLFENMKITSIKMEGREMDFERKYNAVFVDLPTLEKGENYKLTIHYEGHPIIAANAPWDGGFTWVKDKNGKYWTAVSCEGTGASLWWPNKDHLSDEPDSMKISIIAPSDLMAVSNGNLINTYPISKDFTQYDWKVSYPINNYNVTLNVGDYRHFADQYKAADGSLLDLDYYVLKDNLAIAKEHFKQVPEILACFEKYFGKYPFWEDGYALVETPYVGMEHQGAIAYGNAYNRGYNGAMIPEDMDWDYIIVHETGHEYFGNSVSVNDHAEMWIHESFTTYMEALFVECKYSYENALRYMSYFRGPRYIVNRYPIVGPLDVNFTHFGSSDHYFKGSWILHTLRHMINDDEKWFALLKEFYQHYKINHVDTPSTITFFNERTEIDVQPFFQQYLYTPHLPVVEYQIDSLTDNSLKINLRLRSQTADLKMPILMGKKKDMQAVWVGKEWTSIVIKNAKRSDFTIATNKFLIDTEKVERLTK